MQLKIDLSNSFSKVILNIDYFNFLIKYHLVDTEINYYKNQFTNL